VSSRRMPRTRTPRIRKARQANPAGRGPRARPGGGSITVRPLNLTPG
jgi:hypothetical protein